MVDDCSTVPISYCCFYFASGVWCWIRALVCLLSHCRVAALALLALKVVKGAIKVDEVIVHACFRGGVKDIGLDPAIVCFEFGPLRQQAGS